MPSPSSNLDASTPVPPPLPPISGSPRAKGSGPWRLWRPVLLTFGVSLAATLGVIFQLDSWGRGEEEVKVSPVGVAERFVAGLTAGESPITRQESTMGYREAFDLLSTAEQERFGWVGFYRDRVLSDRDGGAIVSSERLQGERLDARGRRLFRYRLRCGEGWEGAASADVHILCISIGFEGSRLAILDWSMTPEELAQIR